MPETPSSPVTYAAAFGPLVEALAGVVRTGEYYSAGTFETPMPALGIRGAGVVSFPVPPDQARHLIDRAGERAPYGKGDKTLTDESVRKVWQISPADIELGGRGWSAAFPRLVAQVAADLGLDPAQVDAEFYKLLIYHEGGFFLAHRDSEKTGGMFGTLVVALPSAHEGGRLHIRHAGRETVVDLRGTDPGEVRYAAFYADCEHEVLPVSSGHRVCLVYNLVQRTARVLPAVPDERPAAEAAARVLRPWAEGEAPPRKLVYLLEHHYTQAGLSLAALKGRDAALARVLIAAARLSGCAAHLGIVHIEESGWAEYTGYGDSYDRSRSRYGRDSEDDESEDDYQDSDDSEYEVGEVCDGRRFIDQWRDADDRPAAFGEIPLDDHEVLPPGALDGEEADETHFSEATGNAGAEFERTYLRAALVLWPESRFDTVCASAGIDAALARLGQLAAAGTPAADSKSQFSNSKSDGDAADARAAALRLARLIPGLWKAHESTPPRFSLLLHHLEVLADAETWSEVAAPLILANHRLVHNPALVRALALFGPARVAPSITGLFTARPAEVPALVVDLWLRLALAPSAAPEADLAHWLELLEIGLARTKNFTSRPATPAYFAMSGDQPVSPAATDTDATAPDQAESPAALARFLATIATTTGDERALAVASVLFANPTAFGANAILLPFLETTESAGPVLPPPILTAAAETCARELLARSELRPAEPKDWAQAAAFSADTPELRELQSFARDPEARVLRIRANEGTRAHLERIITIHGLDMTYVTERQGRPYSLVCTKTRATHERALRRYEADRAAMRRLLALRLTRAAEPSSLAALTARLRTAIC